MCCLYFCVPVELSKVVCSNWRLSDPVAHACDAVVLSHLGEGINGFEGSTSPLHWLSSYLDGDTSNILCISNRVGILSEFSRGSQSFHMETNGCHWQLEQAH